LAAELEKISGVSAQLIRGGGGIFDVKADGDLVFSKFQKGRFPDPGEVEGIIQRLSGS
jgi:selT/selW/selH-like putative selenoprotein